MGCGASADADEPLDFVSLGSAKNWSGSGWSHGGGAKTGNDPPPKRSLSDNAPPPDALPAPCLVLRGAKPSPLHGRDTAACVVAPGARRRRRSCPSLPGFQKVVLVGGAPLQINSPLTKNSSVTINSPLKINSHAELRLPSYGVHMQENGNASEGAGKAHLQLPRGRNRGMRSPLGESPDWDMEPTCGSRSSFALQTTPVTERRRVFPTSPVRSVRSPVRSPVRGSVAKSSPAGQWEADLQPLQDSEKLLATLGSVASEGSSTLGSVASQRTARMCELMRAADAEEGISVDELVAAAQVSCAGYLDLGQMRLDAFPEATVALAEHLEVLACTYNSLATLPPLIAAFTHLKVLKCSNNDLKSLPEALGELTSLVEVDFGFNALSSLPASCAQLVALRSVVLDSNRFTVLPTSLLMLPALESLCIAENHALTALPPLVVLNAMPERLAISIDNRPSLVQSIQALCSDRISAQFSWNKIFPDEILPHVYLGSLRCAQTPLVYRELGIKYVVTCGRNMTVNTEGVERLELEVEDVEEQSLVPYFNRFLEFMAAKKGTGNVLVHCFAGLSRSVTMVLCYLVKEHGMRLDDAMAHVMKVRPNVHPNKTFMRELISYDRAVHGEDARPLDMEHLGDKRTERRLQMMKKRSLQGGN
eukprot:TRINITY_DN4773_c0_g3_i2.p1 TRINITY_DN4773_c0_g3~~TRINITY_DN4773_c0_g3_i2.p1  ORF type:complete len:648 (+),score=182.65 TRINITY_DN4773_c0_g3_i2:188-2131(+)